MLKKYQVNVMPKRFIFDHNYKLKELFITKWLAVGFASFLRSVPVDNDSNYSYNNWYD